MKLMACIPKTWRITVSDVSPPLGLLRYWCACFVDGEVERQYREHRFKDQRRRGMAVLGIVTVFGTMNLVIELSHVFGGDGALPHILALRVFTFLAGVSAVVYVYRTRSQRALENFLTAYGLFLVGVTMFVVGYHPRTGTMSATGVVGTVALIYFFAPLQFPRVWLLAIVMSVGGWSAWTFLRGADPAEDAFRLFLWLATMNLVGAVGCNAQNRTLRALFWEQGQLSVEKARAEAAYERERVALGHFRQFAELISHEFRNPLAIVKGKAQLLQLMSTMDGAEDPEALPAIERAVHRLDTLFSQWLASDRLVEGDIPFQPEMVPLARLFVQVNREVPVGHRHPLTFEEPGDLAVWADPVMLRLVLSNLIDNAQKYSPDGGAIRVGAVRQDDWAVVRVQDHGMGIAPELVERVFDRYFRVSRDSGIRGFGIGLFMVRRIIDMHGGTVHLESALAQGTTVTLRLPLERPAR